MIFCIDWILIYCLKIFNLWNYFFESRVTLTISHYVLWLVGWLVNWFYGISTFLGLFHAKVNFFQYSNQTTSDSHGTLHLPLGLFGMHSAAASMWAVVKFSFLSFGVYVSDISLSASNYHIFIAYISIAKWGPIVTCGFDSWCLISV